MRIQGFKKDRKSLVLMSAALLLSSGLTAISTMPVMAKTKDVKITAESSQSTYDPTKRTKEDAVPKLKREVVDNSSKKTDEASSAGSSNSTAKKDIEAESQNASASTSAAASTGSSSSGSSADTKASTQTITTTTTVTDNDHVWIRANLSYRLDKELYGIDDNAVTFSSPDKWIKQGDWYYYQEPVESGDKIRFINGFSIPTSWDNSTRDKKFEIIATIEAAEALPGETTWNSNSEVAYSQTFDVWNASYTGLAATETVSQSSIKLNVSEYQLNENGKEVTYQNDKLVTPGQKVSKIIEIQVEGQKGKITNIISRITGDSSFLLAWMLGMLVAISAIAASIAALKKQKKGGRR